MSILERCPSYRESNKGGKERQGPTLGVRFTEVSVKRESAVFQIRTGHLKETLKGEVSGYKSRKGILINQFVL